MRGAIFKKFIQLLVLALLLHTFIFYVVASSVLLRQTRSDMMLVLETMEEMTEATGDGEAQARLFKETAAAYRSRYTLLRRDGTVLADTGVGDAALLENHLERQEVQDAIKTGSGYAVRRSETLGERLLYVALLSEDEETIYRLAVPYAGMREYLILLLPAVLLSFVIALIGSVLEAERFSQTITRPLRELAQEMEKMGGEYTGFQYEPCQYQEINVIGDTTAKMSRNMQDYLGRLEKERQIRQEFFSNASHELKTPITSIRGYVELLEGGMIQGREQVQDFLGRIRKETMRMATLVDDILMISRLESRGTRAENIRIRIQELLSETAASLEPVAAERGIRIHLGGGDFLVEADLRYMTELVNNLVSNAVKYNEENGEVWVSAVQRGKQMFLTVRDNGVGIPKESLDRIFERFYRVDKGRSRRQGGTGLGLSIVKHVVNFYHGTVKVESEVGRGSTFTVNLPIAVERK